MAKTAKAKTSNKEPMTGRTRTIRLRVTPEHGERFQAAADEDGSTLSEWLRRVALKASRKP